MSASAWSESDFIAHWAEENCKHLDFVASWETLLGVYKQLDFVDPITDDARFTEFKYIIQQMNKFFSKMEKGLQSASDLDSAIMFLSQHVNAKDINEINTRKLLAYNKYKQNWVMYAINVFDDLNNQLKQAQEGEESDE